ncbi:uncharacterized protein [Euwallacea fornicatus]|uniref:uncharacterized protein isoform X2 n=1 Tax=Euwallacea fornicatus TaxID=995702 RepID=UPI00338F7DB0
MSLLCSVTLIIPSHISIINFPGSSSKVKDYIFEEAQHPCGRKCIQGDPPMVCQYHFKIENYYTMTKACHDCPRNRTDCFRKDCVPGDGYSRGVVTVNRRIPGPSIEVCQNDLVVVDVENHLMSEGTSIHWHGQHMKTSPYMDGVPYVTQCPIPPRTTFRYTFPAVQAGTHFWHSHLGMQRVDGCYGPLIVRVPEEENPHDPLYDYDLSEHTMVLIDWEKVAGMEKFLNHHHSIGDNKPLTLLVNALGRNKVFNYDDNNATYYTPLARFMVDQGYRYRFRIINAGFLNCPVEMSVDNHTITVISSDGGDVAPVEVDSLVTYAGERFDFILSADKPKSLYWIRFRGLMDCDERFMKVFQVAVLEYKSFSNTGASQVATEATESEAELSNNIPTYEQFSESTGGSLKDLMESIEKGDIPESVPDYDNSHRGGKQINSLNKGTEANSPHISMPELSSVRKWDQSLKLKPDYQFFLAFDFYRIDNAHFHGSGYEFQNVTPSSNQLLTPQINHISMQIPSFPLLPQRDQIGADMFCNENTVKGKNCSNGFCECPHAYALPLNSVVELVIIDEGFAFDANHPLHLHGYAFRVVAMEKLGSNVTVEQVKLKERKGLIKRNLLDAPIKDTVTVPDGGYTVVRFQADNPGFWLFHCHLEFHAEIGMALIFKVGEDNQMPPVPQGFPRCGDYLPLVPGDIEPPKPVCSKNALIKNFEKVLFGDYCQDTSAGSGIIGLSSAIAQICLLLWLVLV